MKRTYQVTAFFGAMLILSGCSSGNPTKTPLAEQTPSPSGTAFVPTLTAVPSPTPAPSETPTTAPTSLPTLTSAEAREAIERLFQEPVDCPAPCFWGIVPGRSRLDDAVRAIAHSGLRLNYVNSQDDKEFWQSDFDLESGLEASLNLTILGGIVEILRLYILPEKQQAGIPRAWSAYSPETLVNRYGAPSRVEFSGDLSSESPLYVMVMYFDAHNLIVEYDSPDVGGAQLQICPRTDQMESVRVWMGKDPQDPPFQGLPLEKATSLTMQEFTKIITGPLDKACFKLGEDVFGFR